MKLRIKIKSFLSIIFLFTIVICYSFPLEKKAPPPNSFYVVIGAFSLEKNALKWIDFARKSMRVDYAYNEKRSLYYVWTLITGNKSEAFKLAAELQMSKDYYDTWVYYGDLGKQPVATTLPEVVEESPIEEIIVTPSEPIAIESEPEDEELVEEVVVGVAEPEPEVDPAIAGYKIYFNVIHARTHKEVSGKILVIDVDRNKAAGYYPTHTVHRIKSPNLSGRSQFISDIFGFKKMQIDVNIKEILNAKQNFIELKGDTAIVTLEMIRLKVGDVVTMYNVYFYSDANVMKKESEYELNELLNMLEENNNVRIRIHGHSNGNAKDNIILYNKQTQNFFSVKASQETLFASGQKLSELRAEAIKDWLVYNGINEGRMEIKGWGAKNSLYKKFDEKAYLNVRVEIEILGN